MPTIIALEMSNQKPIRTLAHELHQRLHAKHESLIEGCYIDGVKRAVQYRELMGHFPKITNESYLSLLYSVVKSNRQARRKFLQALVRAIDFDILKWSKNPKFSVLIRQHLKFVTFVVENLSNLDYGFTEEVYIVVHSVERIVSGTGTSILYFITEWQANLQLSGEGDLNQQLVTVDKTSDLQMSLQQLTICSAVMYLIYKLQNHLKRLYALNDQTCRSFQPSKLPKDTRSAVKAQNVPAQLETSYFPWIEADTGFENLLVNQELVEQVKEYLSAGEGV